jgi:hypothetical protein
MENNYGLSPAEIDTVQTINPELAAHNIALAYISSTANPEKLYKGEAVILDDVLSLSSQYVEAYNYAYNYVTHENKLIKEAE